MQQHHPFRYKEYGAYFSRVVRGLLALGIASIGTATLNDSYGYENFSESYAASPETATFRYYYGYDPNQFAELWLPRTNKSHPLAILIHGGCWSTPGNFYVMNSIARDLRDSGIAVWNMEYRRLGNYGGGYPGTFRDIATGIDYVRRIRHFYKLDLSNVILIGHSSGGHLALWAAGRRQIPQQSKLYIDNPLPIRTVISLSGIADLAAFRHQPYYEGCDDKKIDALVHGAEKGKENDYVDISPIAMLPLGVRQLIVMENDPAWPEGLNPILPQELALFYIRKAQSTGDEATLLSVQSSHTEMLNTESDAWQQIKPAIMDALNITSSMNSPAKDTSDKVAVTRSP